MKKTGLYKRMLIVAVVPVLLLSIVIMWFCYIRFTNTIYNRERIHMGSIAREVMYSYDLAYPGEYCLVKGADETYDLYKGDSEITDDYSIVDSFGETNAAEISLLYMDMRVNTTFQGEDGTRFAGLCTNKETTDKVINNREEVFYSHVSMFDDEYLVLYVPVYSAENNVVGMVEVAKPSSDMKKAVLKAVWPILLLAVLGMLAAAFVSYKNTKEITGVLKKLQIFMNKVAGGNLQAELDTAVLARMDELGDISKSSTAMQKSIRSFVENDPLTGLGNRRYIHSQLQKIMDRHEDTGVPFSVAIGDIDFFKKVNDTYGHNAGDEVLKAVASKLKFHMQGRGFAGRWGGEEFVMVFDKVAMYDAADYLWKLLEDIREMVVEAEGYEIKVTMTFGVVDGCKADIETLVEGADAKLYFGKQNGRNRVVVETTEE